MTNYQFFQDLFCFSQKLSFLPQNPRFSLWNRKIGKQASNSCSKKSGRVKIFSNWKTTVLLNLGLIKVDLEFSSSIPGLFQIHLDLKSLIPGLNLDLKKLNSRSELELSKKTIINWEKRSKTWFWLLSLVENQRLTISNCWEIS